MAERGRSPTPVSIDLPKADEAQAAERIACDEAAGLRAELDARRQWGL
jgi:hypothetical protein